jgi:polysaccharide export outer membrane protein
MYRLWLMLCFAVAVALSSPPIAAQNSSSQQLQLLRSLSTAEREALIKQFGARGSDAESGIAADVGAGSRDLEAQNKLQFTAEPEAPPGQFRTGDTVLVELDFIKGRPARLDESIPGQPPSVVPAEPPPEYSLEERAVLGAFIDLIRSKNPYTINDDGVIAFPGLREISIAGLNEVEAGKLISSDPAFRRLAVTVSRLPVEKRGSEGLKPFGYELFQSAPSTFAPTGDVPVPADYVVGAGDELVIQIFGSKDETYRLKVGRDGVLSIPEIGPISVAGKSFESARADIDARIRKQLIGAQSSVSLAETRAIRVFVVGEARNPGSYTVSGLATATSALYASGGVKETGSLRDIQVKRGGTIVGRLDLYDLLLRGDTSGDVRLAPGDVIFIPPIGVTVAIDGAVRRPAIYELKGATSVASALLIAGGLTAESDPGVSSIVRLTEDRRRVAFDVDVSSMGGKAVELRNGDVMTIGRARPTLDSGVRIEGHVFRPGIVGWHDGIRLTDVIRSVDDLKPNADLHYVLIRRETMLDRRTTFLSADLTAALKNPGGPDDVLLASRDRILVFDAEGSRRPLLDPLIAELRRQGRSDQPADVVSISGRIIAPGDYPLEPEMRISDLLRAGGRLEDSAYAEKAELTRFRNIGSERRSELLEVDLGAIVRGDVSADVLLQPYDILVIKELPEWSRRESVKLTGEVKFPGVYPIRRGETLRSVVERAGGLTILAFPKGAVFSRKELREREEQEIARLVERLQSDLAASALQMAQASQTMQSGSQSMIDAQSLLGDLKGTKAVGRLVVDLDRVLSAPLGSFSDIVLRDGDELVIPPFRQEVTVLGEVQNGTSHLYRPGLDREDYISLSGGLTRRADHDRIYIVRADGSVAASSSSWLGAGRSKLNIQPGDTIVAPLNTERLPALPLWQAVTSILYNVAIATAAVKSL